MTSGYNLLFTFPDHRRLCLSVYFWLTLLALCHCLSGKPTTATAASVHRWSLAELSVTSSELPKQIPAPPYPALQQRVQSTPHYDQQLKLPSGNGVGLQYHYYPWTQPTVSVLWADFYICDLHAVLTRNIRTRITLPLISFGHLPMTKTEPDVTVDSHKNILII